MTERPLCSTAAAAGSERRAHSFAASARERPNLIGWRREALPNPSGLNAHYQVEDLARVYGALRAGLERAPDRERSTTATAARSTSTGRAGSV